MGHSSRTIHWCVGLLVVLVAVVVVSAGLGSVRIHPLDVAKSGLNGIVLPVGATVDSPWSTPSVAYRPLFSFDVEPTHETIVTHVRLPRILLAATVGCALAVAGTVMQGFFRNPLADPSIIGVSAGAAAGAVAVIAFPALVPFATVHSAAFAGALVTAFGVYAIATKGGRTPVATLLLVGIAVQTFLGAVISYMVVHSGENLRQAVLWMMGHLHNATWNDVAFALPFTLVGATVLWAYADELNVLLHGEEEAHYLGVAVERTKLVLLALASVVTAAGVAVAGVIGFVGLVVPHIMRLLVGPDHRILLPTSAIAGAAFLVVTDTIARLGPVEVPVGIVTAAVGAPFFLFLLTRREVHAL